MDGPWAEGVLFAVAAVPAALLLAFGLAMTETRSRGPITVMLVAGLTLAAVALGRLGHALAGDDFLSHGGSLTWMLAAFTALAAICARRTRSTACLLIAALAAVGLLVELVNWAFGTEAVDTFRVLLAIAFAALFVAGLAVGGRAGTILVSAAGVTVLAAAYVLGAGAFFVLGTDTAWGWELVMLAQGLALAAFAVQRLEPGPGYLAFFVLASFVSSAAFARTDPEFETVAAPDATLVGWPLALAVGTAAAALWGVRRARMVHPHPR
jgi:hypothetical protein